MLEDPWGRRPPELWGALGACWCSVEGTGTGPCALGTAGAEHGDLGGPQAPPSSPPRLLRGRSAQRGFSAQGGGLPTEPPTAGAPVSEARQTPVQPEGREPSSPGTAEGIPVLVKSEPTPEKTGPGTTQDA
uniref:Uncharacterized protein n=1 Tax=Molossus molossus TaxID=27622 RepID=A0A7J8J0I4_MOLMO|nr:hypothetical protein HJG59_010248 [Molossus molossus]